MGFFTSILGQISFLEYVSFETWELGNGSPEWREAEVQGGEGFDIAPTGRHADLLATAGEEGKLRSNIINERLQDASEEGRECSSGP